jgi:ABC-type multidrug transport system fused ATPase/permease subunit
MTTITTTSSAAGASTSKIPTWKALGKLFSFKPTLFAADVLSQIPRQMMFLLPGLIVREVFNSLTANGGVTWGFWALLALLIASAFARVAAIYLGATLDEIFNNYAAALLRKNLFQRILSLPAARALPYSPGETITRLGGDVNEITLFINNLMQAIGMATLLLWRCS